MFLPELQFLFKICMLQDEFKRSKFPFGMKSKFPTEFELKIEEANLI
jgi:hypothetical protein